MQLLRKENAWLWDHPQQSAFQQVKELLTSPPILAHYDAQKPTIIAADASTTGIGAVLLQVQNDGTRKPEFRRIQNMSLLPSVQGHKEY